MSQRAASARLVVACLLFFLSGLTALVYQVVWQRLLILFSGADVHATTIIVGAFMAGLGCGSLAGGHIADRLSRRGNLLAFAAAELAIGLFGYVSVPLYYDLLHIRLGHVVHDVLMPALLFLSLLWPTFFMGASLPLLARALTLRLERAASTLGVLYGVNALGASAGALLTTWWMLPRLGLQGSLMLSAGANALVGMLAVLLATRTSEEHPSSRASSVDHDGDLSGETLPFAAWIWLNGITGFL